MARGEIDRIRYLRSRLLEDLAGGRKLFVYKGRSTLAMIRELAAALQGYGSNCLLWVDLAQGAHAPGTVERDSGSLLRGFVSRFGTYEGSPSLPVEEWVAVCAQAYRLWRNEDPPRRRLDNLLTGAPAAGTARGSAVPQTAARPSGHTCLADDLAVEHRLTPEPRAVGHVHLPIRCGGNFLFSAWVKIPAGCEVSRITPLLTGYPTLTGWGADLKSRGTWQRAWVHAQLPDEARVIACELHAAGPEGGSFHSGGWCLERGTHPCGHGFSL